MRSIDDGRPVAPTVVAAETPPAILRDYAELPEGTELGLERVVATTMTVNVASRRVLEKAGLSLVRTFYAQCPTYITGAEHGDVVYEIAGQDWRSGYQPSSRSRSSPMPK